SFAMSCPRPMWARSCGGNSGQPPERLCRFPLLSARCALREGGRHQRGGAALARCLSPGPRSLDTLLAFTQPMTLPALLPEITVLERGWLSANNFVFVGRHETAVVDTGYCAHAAQTVALVRATLAERPLDRILNTHLH